MNEKHPIQLDGLPLGICIVCGGSFLKCSCHNPCSCISEKSKIQKAMELVEEIAKDKHPYYHRQERVMFNEIWDFDVCKYCGGDNGADVQKVQHNKNCIYIRAKEIIKSK